MNCAAFLVVGVCVLGGAPAFASETECGELSSPGQFGPFDYRTAHRQDLAVVEKFHFTPDIAMASPTRTPSDLGGQYDYVLRAFPNHPRAFFSMMKLWERLRMPKKLPGMSWSVECYFERAIRWRSDDALTFLAYAIYLGKIGRKEDSITALFKAEEHSGAGNGNVLYNLGLAFFERGDYERALLYAHRAYALGFNLPGLKSKLVSVGRWREPSQGAGSQKGETSTIGSTDGPRN